MMLRILFFDSAVSMVYALEIQPGDGDMDDDDDGKETGSNRDAAATMWKR
jgi:hypothetical protein